LCMCLCLCCCWFHCFLTILIDCLSLLKQGLAEVGIGFKNMISMDIAEKVECPGGAALLRHVGYVYINEAKQHLGRFFGIEGFISGLEEKGKFIRETISIVRFVWIFVTYFFGVRPGSHFMLTTNLVFLISVTPLACTLHQKNLKEIRKTWSHRLGYLKRDSVCFGKLGS